MSVVRKYLTIVIMIILLVFFNLLSSHLNTGSVALNKRMKTNFAPANNSKKIMPSILNSSKYHPVTYASHSGIDDRFCRTMESAARHGIRLTILGWGIPWRGLFQKLEAALNLTSALPPEDVVLFVDAFDILFTRASSQVPFLFLSADRCSHNWFACPC
jgi:hypothetical protein